MFSKNFRYVIFVLPFSERPRRKLEKPEFIDCICHLSYVFTCTYICKIINKYYKNISLLIYRVARVQ